MVRTFEQAIAKLSGLPDTDQEEIGRKLLSHVERLNALRVELNKGIRSLDAGEGRPLDIEEFLRQKHSGSCEGRLGIDNSPSARRSRDEPESRGADIDPIRTDQQYF